MSTNIVVDVALAALRQLNQAQVNANRQAKLLADRDSTLAQKAVDADAAAKAQQGQDRNGALLYGIRSDRRRPQEQSVAVSRTGIDSLKLGHLWIFADATTRSAPAGIYQISSGFPQLSKELSLELPQGHSLLLGSGNGSSWQSVFSGVPVGAVPAPPLKNSFSLLSEGPAQYYDVSEGGGVRQYAYFGSRAAATAATSDLREGFMALPTGDGNFILIVFYSYAWYRTIETGYWSAIKILAEDGSTLGGFTYPPDQMSESDTSYIIGNPTMQPDNGRISFEVQSGSGRSVSVFACNNSTIRPIDLPATMEAIVSELLPAPSSATLTTDFRGLTQSYTIPTVSSSFFGPAVYGNCGGYSNDGWGNVYSPEIYGILNDSAGFVNAGQIKTFPTSQRWGLMDASSGGYQKFQTGSPSYPWWSDCYRDGDPLKHALWKNANEEPDLRVWDPAYSYLELPAPTKVPSATLTLSGSRPERPGSVTETTPGAYEYETLVTVWDWNDPAYCIAMATALGFTTGDLTP